MPLLGELASLGCAVCWAVGLTLFRRDVRGIGARPVNLFKGLFASSLYLAYFAFRGVGEAPLDAQLAIALSGLVGLALGDTLLFTALGRLGPHKTALLNSLGPVITVLGGWMLLDERLRLWQLVGIALATLGVTIVVYFRGGPSVRADRSGIWFGVAAAACQAGGVLLAKRGLYEMDALDGTALRLLAATAALAVVALFRGDLGLDLRRMSRAGPLSRLIPAALIGTFGGLWLMQLGIKHASPGVANALHSTTPLFTLPIAVFLLRERIGPLAVLGSVVGVGGVVLLLLS